MSFRRDGAKPQPTQTPPRIKPAWWPASVDPSVANPIKFQQAPTHYDRAPPTLGQHSEEILREAGYADSEIENLRSGGIV